MMEETLFPESDAVITAGEEDAMIVFRISSVKLSLASPVFAAMYSRGFSETHDLADRSASTHLDEQPDLVRILLQCIHGKQLPVRTRMATKDLLQLVVLGDKYACTESLTMLAVDQYEKIWRRHAQHPSEHIEECIDMLTIGYLTKRNEIFMEASRMLVNENARQYQDLCKNHRAWPPDFVMMWLEISRMRLKECFFKSLMPALYHECADLPDNHAAIHALKPALGADSDWVRSGSVRGIIELREAFINRAKGDKAFCASCEDGVIPLSVFENEHSEAGGSWYGLCVHCCHARAGDPYKCDGGCIDEDMKADEEHAV